jgi:hypothetical protein
LAARIRRKPRLIENITRPVQPQEAAANQLIGLSLL